jgi:uncharacterized membrane protein
MLPFLVLLLAFVLFLLAGQLGILWLQVWTHALRAALACMLLLTASAHWGRRRKDLIAMVPRSLPNPGLIVTITGVLELAGAAGLILKTTHRVAGFSLAVLFVAMFSANVRAARNHLTIDGRPVLGVVARGLIQVVFIAAALLCALYRP